ncbi:hypothetical protein FOS14_22755 [Skermania sp. ID1734]|nr:hypothetical protein FOS14_22755 [Skermania sp. ID1734]
MLGDATKILRTFGLDATADLAERKLAAGPPLRAVVIVGEVKRGKSALVNALIGERDAAPVDVDVATSAVVQFVAADHDHPADAVELVFPGSAQRVPRSELADWVTASGKHVADPLAESLPTRAVVAVDALVPGDPMIIDTPGVGGLDPMYAQLAVQSTERACVVVVVCDATSPITAPEMNFVKQAVATVESVIVVVTKTDKNIRRWQPIVAENQRLLREHLRRDIPVLGVSSTLAVAAAQMTDLDRRHRLEQASGVTQLRALIAARLAIGNQLGTADALRTAAEGLREVHKRITTDIAITSDAQVAVPDLTAERDRLQKLKDQASQWEHYLARDMTLARQAAMNHLDEQLEQVRTKWNKRLAKNGFAVLRRNPQVFTAEIEADLLAAMTATCQLYLDRLQEIVTPLCSGPEDWQAISEFVVAALQVGPLNAGEVAKKRQNLLDPTVLSMGTLGTSALGTMLGIGPLAGVLWIAVNLSYRAMRNGKQHLLTWLRETLVLAKTQVGRMLEAATSIARPEIVIRYREDLRRQMETVQRQLAEAAEAAKMDAAKRDATLKRLASNQRAVTARLNALESEIAALTAGLAS